VEEPQIKGEDSLLQ
jgi:hypothetical protein